MKFKMISWESARAKYGATLVVTDLYLQFPGFPLPMWANRMLPSRLKLELVKETVFSGRVVDKGLYVGCVLFSKMVGGVMLLPMGIVLPVIKQTKRKIRT